MDSSTKKMSGSLNHAMIDGEQAKRAQHYADHFDEPGFNDPTQMYIDQRYEGYTPEVARTHFTSPSGTGAATGAGGLVGL